MSICSNVFKMRKGTLTRAATVFLAVVLTVFIFSQAGFAQAGKVNINTASVEELMELPGVGEATAKRIVEQREKKKFEKTEELMEIKGIGQKKYDKMKNDISVGK